MRKEVPQTGRGRWRRTIALSGATVVIAGSAVLLGGSASPASAAAPDRVVACHATASQTDPCVPQEVNARDISPQVEGDAGQGWDTGAAGVMATSTTNPVAADRHAPAGGALWLGAVLILASVGGLTSTFRPGRRGVH